MASSGLCVPLPSLCWGLVWLGLAQVCDCCHSHPESLWAAALLSPYCFPCVLLLPQLLVASHPGFYNDFWALGGRGNCIDVPFSCSVFLPKTTLLQRRQCCHRKKVKSKERNSTNFMTFTLYQVLDLLAGWPQAWKWTMFYLNSRVCTRFRFLVMVLVLPSLLEEAFRMMHASFPHADPWSILAATGCGWLFPCSLCCFLLGQASTFLPRALTSFVHFLETLCFSPQSCDCVSLGKHWRGMANQAGSSACQEGSVITDMRYSKCWSW